MIFDDFGRKWLGILRLRPISKAFSKGKKNVPMGGGPPDGNVPMGGSTLI